MLSAKYNFDKNLIKASYNKNIYGAKKEWVVVGKTIKDDKSGLCLCQHKVKHITYMYNELTKHTIIVGSTCSKKFEMNNMLLPNRIFRDILLKNLEKGDYEVIDNIIRYSNSIEEQFINYFETKIENNNNKNELTQIKKEIKELIDNNKLIYLSCIYDIVSNKINKVDIHIELINNFLIYTVKTYITNYAPGAGSDIDYNENKFKTLDECNDFILTLKPLGLTIHTGYGWSKQENTLEKIEILQNNNVIKIYDKPKENTLTNVKILQNNNVIKPNNQISNKYEENKSRIPENKCICGISKTNICICNTANTEKCKLSNNLFCINCNNWICRCK